MEHPLSPDEIKKMKASCRLAARTLKHVGSYVRQGISTNELDKIAHDFTLSHGARPAPLNYNGFPKSICTSVNECVCHGVPDETVLKEGDIVNVDVTCELEGFYGDTSCTFAVGEVSEKAQEIIECAQAAMHKGIEQVGPGVAVGDIGFTIQRFVTRQGFWPVKELGGHGIGRVFHTEPFVPSFGKKGKGLRLRPWTCITVEPMINAGTDMIKEFDIPNSTIKYYETVDKSLSAQFEHTLLITDKSYEILTVDE